MRSSAIYSAVFMMVASLAGCRDETSNGSEGGSGGSGGGGGGGAGSEPTSASITVATLEGPIAGADVVFHDATGAPTAHVRTDGAGRASADVEPGALITVLLLDDMAGLRSRATFVGVMPGDELTYRSLVQSGNLIGTATVTIPAFPGADWYVLSAGCAEMPGINVNLPVDLPIFQTCLSPDGTLDFLATASYLGQPIGYSWVRDCEWAAPMSVTMPPWVNPAMLTVTATSAPAGTVEAFIGLDYGMRQRSFAGSYSYAPLGPGEETAFSMFYAPQFGDLIETTVGVGFGPAPGHYNGHSYIVERAVSPPALRSVNLGADLLARVSPPVYDLSDPGRPTLSWAAPASIAETDGGAVSLYFSEAGVPQVWSFLIPPDTPGTVQAPALPEELASWAPSATASYAPGTVDFFDADWMTSYDDLRQGPGFGLALGTRDGFPEGASSTRFTGGY
jgi:hypothetical protein